MRKKRLFWEIFPSFLAMVVVCIVAVQAYSSRIIREVYYSRIQSELRAGVTIFAEQLKSQPDFLAAGNIDPLCKKMGDVVGHRFTVVLLNGKVVGDSDKEPDAMDNHGNRPEIIKAFSGQVGLSKRYSHTLQKWMMYAAVPMTVDGKNVAAARAAVPLSDVERSINALRSQSLVAGLVIILAAGFMSILISGRISRPLQDIRRGAQAFGSGDLQGRLPSSPVAEIDVLSDTMNRMAEQLNERISTITQQRDEQNSLLACMMEGVIAVDLEKRIIRMNKSCRNLFGVEDPDIIGKGMEEVVRNPDILRIIDRTLKHNEIFEGDIYLADRDRYLQAHGTLLHDAEGQRIGALIVLNDITRLRKLETVRRDFVANVSHELKTPITSIKGFAETLLDGATENKEDLDRFLQIINKQAERLQSIVEDLLVLSGIEHDADKNEIALQESRINNILDSAVQSCRTAASAKGINIHVEKDEGLKASANIQLLEQALVNLVDNAIKYSGEKTEILVSGRRTDKEIVLSVTDRGTGIAKKHLPRLFERFYRVDKSRSRDLGGTGLGLAIVKRVAIAHGGRVEVESELGKGSTFSIILPAV